MYMLCYVFIVEQNKSFHGYKKKKIKKHDVTVNEQNQKSSHTLDLCAHPVHNTVNEIKSKIPII